MQVPLGPLWFCSPWLKPLRLRPQQELWSQVSLGGPAPWSQPQLTVLADWLQEDNSLVGAALASWRWRGCGVRGVGRASSRGMVSVGTWPAVTGREIEVEQQQQEADQAAQQSGPACVEAPSP